MNWVVMFAVLRDGERSVEDGSPRYISKQPFPVPDIDQTVLHRGEAFVVDDVIWDLERNTVTVELVPLVEDAIEHEGAKDGDAEDAEDGDAEDAEDGDAEDAEDGDAEDTEDADAEAL